MKALRVEFELTREDITSQLRTAIEKDPGVRQTVRRLKRTYVILIALLVALEVVACLAFNRLDPILVLAGVAGVLWLVWHWPNRRWVHRHADRQARAIFATQAGIALLGPRAVEAGPAGLSITSDYGRTVFHWRAVLELTPTPHHLFLVLPGPAYLAIPRRAFEFDDDFRRFADAVAEWAAAREGLAAEYPLGR